jgi:hypothetical protein
MVDIGEDRVQGLGGQVLRGINVRRCRRSVFGERQLGQSFQEPCQIIIIKPAGGYMETPDIYPFAGLEGGLVTESPFLEPGRLSEGDRFNPAF